MVVGGIERSRMGQERRWRRAVKKKVSVIEVSNGS